MPSGRENILTATLISVSEKSRKPVTAGSQIENPQIFDQGILVNKLN